MPYDLQNPEEERLYRQNILRANVPLALTNFPTSTEDLEISTSEATRIWSDIEPRVERTRSSLDIIKALIAYAGNKDVKPPSYVNLRESIIKQKRKLLESEYKGKAVAITYEGRIVGSADNVIDLLKKLQTIDYPADQIFLHAVDEEPAGWL